MDPNACLNELRALLDPYNHRPLDEDQQNRVFELFESLDDWLKEGGMLPLEWEIHRPIPKNIGIKLYPEM